MTNEAAAGPDVSIIIVAYGALDLLEACVASIPPALGDRAADVWIVDNGTVGDVWQAFHDRPGARVLRGSASLGFGRANNLAAAAARGRALLFLNPDTELPAGGVAALLGTLDRHPTAAIVGPRLRLPDGSLDPAGRRNFPTPASAATRLLRVPAWMRPSRLRPYNPQPAGSEPAAAEVEAVSGACMLVRREAFESLGGFDPGYFMYGEDLDLAWRAQQSGWRTLYFSSVDVRHWKRQSSRRREVRTRFEFYRAMWRFYHAHRSNDPVLVKALVSATIAAIGTAAVTYRVLRHGIRW